MLLVMSRTWRDSDVEAIAGVTAKCNARQKAAAPDGLECREPQSAIEDDISRSGKSPEYSTLHAVITMLFHACL